jgi:hypothetical protein
MRTTPEELLALRVRSGDANALARPGRRREAAAVPLRELVTVERTSPTRASITRTSCP